MGDEIKPNIRAWYDEWLYREIGGFDPDDYQSFFETFFYEVELEEIDSYIDEVLKEFDKYKLPGYHAILAGGDILVKRHENENYHYHHLDNGKSDIENMNRIIVSDNFVKCMFLSGACDCAYGVLEDKEIDGLGYEFANPKDGLPVVWSRLHAQSIT